MRIAEVTGFGVCNNTEARRTRMLNYSHRHSGLAGTKRELSVAWEPYGEIILHTPPHSEVEHRETASQLREWQHSPGD